MSIIRNVIIKNKKVGQVLVSALENAEGKTCKEVVFTRPVRELSKKEIYKTFKGM